MNENPTQEAILRTWQRLTPREKQIALLTAQNLTNKEIAYKLTISPDTVKTHVRNALEKFNLSSKADLRLVLVINGLMHPSKCGIYEITEP